ncbi:MAG: hypothetical protein KF684_04265 [Phycisphaeraceae bacterium]|nr:hypothetical protein [Phycisphaeraceae bacterium]
MTKVLFGMTTGVILAAMGAAITQDLSLVWYIVPAMLLLTVVAAGAERGLRARARRIRERERFPLEAKWLLVQIANSKMQGVMHSSSMNDETLIVDKGITGYIPGTPDARRRRCQVLFAAVELLEGEGALRLTDANRGSRTWKLTAKGDMLADSFRGEIPEGYDPTEPG